jgi:hypothetical protein
VQFEGASRAGNQRTLSNSCKSSSVAENKQAVAIFGVHVELLDREAPGAGLIRCIHYTDKHSRCWLEPDHPPPVLFLAHDPDTRITLATCSSLSALPDQKQPQ